MIIFVWALISVFALIFLCATVLNRWDSFEGVEHWKNMKRDSKNLVYDKTHGLWVPKPVDESTAAVESSRENLT